MGVLVTFHLQATGMVKHGSILLNKFHKITIQLLSWAVVFWGWRWCNILSCALTNTAVWDVRMEFIPSIGSHHSTLLQVSVFCRHILDIEWTNIINSHTGFRLFICLLWFPPFLLWWWYMRLLWFCTSPLSSYYMNVLAIWMVLACFYSLANWFHVVEIIFIPDAKFPDQ